MSDEYAKRLRQAADEIAKAGHYGWGNTCVFAADHIERLTAELKDLRDEAEHYDDLIARQGALLRGVVNAIKGPPPDDTLWSHHDAPELAAGVMAELEALRIYESMASEYGLSVFEDLRTLKVYAERYKRLRESDAPYLLVYAFCGDRDEVVTGHDLDRAIDEARKGAA